MGMKFENVNKYSKTFNDAMHRWGLYSRRYQTLIDEYNDLLEQKRQLNIVLDGIKKADLKKYPEIEFLRIKNEEEAKEYLEDRTPKQIALIVQQIDDMVQTNFVYRSLIAKVEDYKKQIKEKTGPKKDWYAAPIPKAAKSAACKRTCAGED